MSPRQSSASHADFLVATAEGRRVAGRAVNGLLVGLSVGLLVRPLAPARLGGFLPDLLGLWLPDCY